MVSVYSVTIMAALQPRDGSNSEQNQRPEKSFSGANTLHQKHIIIDKNNIQKKKNNTLDKKTRQKGPTGSAKQHESV